MQEINFFKQHVSNKALKCINNFLNFSAGTEVMRRSYSSSVIRSYTVLL